MVDHINLISDISLTNKELASALKLPSLERRQKDLLYFTAILVSSGANLNHAYFLPTELVKAGSTIINKAVDIEHDEQKVVGHIYDKAFMWKDHSVFDPETVEINDDMEIDIAVAGIIYRERFPSLAKEVEDGDKWKLSMECYYEDYEIRVGNIKIPSREAKALGYHDMVGKFAVAKFNDSVVAADVVVRILKNIMFSGCGLVENPANPPSVILEVASISDRIKDAENRNMIISLDNVESWMKAKQEAEALSVSSDIMSVTGTDAYSYVTFGSNTSSSYQFDDKAGDADATQVSVEASNLDKESLVKNVLMEVKRVMACKKCEELYVEFSRIMESMAIAKECLNEERSAKWTVKYINDLPNSAFICIEKGYKDGESPKAARHLPYKDKDGNVDLPHLRNALARCSLIKSVLGTETDEELRKRACAKAKAIAKKYLKTYKED